MKKRGKGNKTPQVIDLEEGRLLLAVRKGYRNWESRFKEEFGALDERHKSIVQPEPFPVALSPGLQKLQKRIVHEVKEKELGES